MVALSIVVPALNEEQGIEATLAPLQLWRNKVGEEKHDTIEIIVADGGSSDNTVVLATPLADRVLHCSPGRARQMNAGAAVARGQYLLFLHADTRLPVSLPESLNSWRLRGVQWGFFPLVLSGQSLVLRIIERAINVRSSLTAVCTGDQCQYVRRDLFEHLGGFPDLPLMEDVALSKRLRKQSRPSVELLPVVTSSRRWEQRGIVKTVLLMWSLRLAYFCGVSPRRLAEIYYPGTKS